MATEAYVCATTELPAAATIQTIAQAQNISLTVQIVLSSKMTRTETEKWKGLGRVTSASGLSANSSGSSACPEAE